MERRDFLKLCSMTGLAVVAGATAGRSEAKVEKYTGPLHLFIHQGGGWDVTNICDPKGGASAAEIDTNGESDVMNHYLTSDIGGDAGGVRWAPLETVPGLQGQQGNDVNTKFFSKFKNDLLVINSIDMMTNSHDVGTRAIWAGDLTEGKPTVAALIAASFNPESPMAFISFGGYDVTGGTVASTRLGNVEAIKRLAFPFRKDPNEPESLYLSDATQARITKARTERFEAAMKQQRLPRIRTAMSTLYLSRLGQNELKQLVEFLPEDVMPGLPGAVQLIAAAYRAGLCVSANLSTGGWDTHGNDDQGVRDALGGLLGFPAADEVGTQYEGYGSGVHGMMEVLKEQTIDNNTVIYMGSDFGRTPGYNMGNGKDHYAVSSMMVMGAVAGKKIKGNRVVGVSDERHMPIDLDPVTLAEKPGGKRIKPGHIQNAIRKLAGMQESDVSRMFPTTESTDEFADIIQFA